eukprot:TRINITY_DN11904_c0_g1_i2.p1 TRINITY_DN11904_c0_g1~~TRINITY_DN11904_c0_g1_i2.p1  ORF type:complete len:1250 (+),score=411.80 TRINITY_DN11904_c0_g1_i2:2-3751(+)
MKADLARSMEQHEVCKTHLTDATRELETLREQTKLSLASIQAGEEVRASQDQEIEAKNETLEEQKTQLLAFQDEIRALNELLAQSSSREDERSATISNMQEQLNTYRDQLQQTTQSQETSTNMLLQRAEAAEQSLVAITAVEGDLRRTVHELQEAIRTHDTAVHLHATERASLQVAVATLEATVAAQEEQIAQREEAASALEMQVQSLDEQIAELNQRIATLSESSPSPAKPASAGSFRASISTSPGSPQNLQARLETASISNELLREENANLQREIKGIDAMRQQLEDSIAAREALKQEIARLNLEHQQLACKHQEENVSLSDVIHALQQKINNADASQLTVADKLDEANKAIEREKALQAQLAKEAAVNKNLRDDMQRLFKKNRKDIQDIRDQYQNDNYKERYARAVRERKIVDQQMQGVMSLMEQLYSDGSLHTQIYASIKDNTAFLEEEGSTFKFEHAKLVREMQFYSDELTKVKGHEEELSSLVASLSASIATLTEQNTRLASENEQVQSRLCGVNLDMQSECEALRDNNTSLSANISALTSKFSEAQGAIDQLTEENNTLSFEVTELQAQGEQLQEDLTTERTHLAEVEQALGERTSELGSLQDTLTARVEELEATRTELTRRGVEAVVQDLISSVVGQAQSRELNRLRHLATTYETQIAELQDREDALDSAAHEEQVTRLQLEIARLCRQHDELSEFVEQEISVRDEQEQEQARQISLLQGQERALKEQVSCLQSTVSSQEQQVEDQARALDAAHFREDVLKQQCESSHTRVVELEQEIGEAANTLNILREQHTALAASCQDLTGQLDAANETAAQREATVKDDSDKLQAVEAQLAEARNRLQEAQTRHDMDAGELLRAKEAAETEATALRASVAEGLARLSTARLDCDQLQDVLQATKTQLRELEEAQDAAARSSHEQLAALQEALSRATLAEADRAREVSEVSTKYGQTAADLQSTRERLTSAISSLSTLEKDKAALQASVARLHHEMQSIPLLEQKVQQLAHHANAQKDREAQLVQEYNEKEQRMSDEIKQTSARLEETSAKLTKVNEEAVQLRLALQKVVKNNTLMKAASEEQWKEVEKSRQVISALEERMQTADSQMKSLAAEKAQALAQIDTLQALVHEKASSSSKSSASNDQLEQEMSSLASKLDESKKENQRLLEDVQHTRAFLKQYKEASDDKNSKIKHLWEKAEAEVDALGNCLFEIQESLDQNRPLFQKDLTLARLWEDYKAKIGPVVTSR